jgi:hypothetical protein
MISGNIHLSSDLRRLAFVRLLVWLTTPRTRMNRVVLVKKYRKVIEEHRVEYDWNKDPKSEREVSGIGMGSSKRRAERDVIAFNHLTLAQDLQFLRKGETRWTKNGYILASLSSNEEGKPFFYDEVKLEEELRREGFVATLGKGEQLIFSTALIELDVDRILPLLSTLEKNVPTTGLADRFLSSVDKWLEKKIEFEPNSFKRSRIRLERRSIKEKISRLEVERTQPGSTLRAKRKEPSVKIYCHEQTSPRLHFLQDLSYIEKNKRGFYLSEKGFQIKKALINPLYEELNVKNVDTLVLRDETSLLETIVNLSTEGFPPLDFEKFKTLFSKIARFYTRSGVILLSYFNTFRATASKATESSVALPLKLFDDYMSRLAELKLVTVSTSGRGTKYIKVYRRLKPS